MTEGSDNICHLGKGEIPAAQEHDYGQEYAELQAANMTEAFLRFGLDSEIASILHSYLSDLHLIVQLSGKDTSYLSFRTLDTTDKKQKRVLILSEKDLLDRISFLSDALKQNPTYVQVEGPAEVLEFTQKGDEETVEVEDEGEEDEEDDEDQGPKKYSFHVPANAPEPTIKDESFSANYPKVLQDIAIDWIFAEQTVAALGIAYYMKNAYDGYMPDYGGTRHKAHLSVSAAYLVDADNRKQTDSSVAEDFKDMKFGFGLQVLHESLLKYRAVDSIERADRIILGLRWLRPTALDTPDIIDRIENLKTAPDIRATYPTISLGGLGLAEKPDPSKKSKTD